MDALWILVHSRWLRYSILIVAILVLLPLLSSYALVNSTSLAHLRELGIDHSSTVSWQQPHLARSLWDTPASRWAAARAELLADHATAAAEVLGEQKDFSRLSPLFYDRLALGYLEHQAFDQVVRLRPFDLYANYRLWEAEPTDELHNRLRYFPAEAVISNIAELRDYTRRSAPLLVAARLWSPEMIERVDTVLDWQRDQLPQIPAMGAERNNLLRSFAWNTTNISLSARQSFWTWQAYAGADGQGALFVGGSDEREQRDAVCLVGLWRRPDSMEHVAPYAEFVSPPLILEPGQRYRLFIRYKTDSFHQTVPLVALMDYSSQPHFVFTHTILPNTDGSWQEWTFTAIAPTEAIPLRFIVRNWGEGAVWFAQPQLEIQPLG